MIFLPNIFGGSILRKEADSIRLKDWLHSPPDAPSSCLGLGWRERGEERTSGDVTVADVEVAVDDCNYR